MLGPRSPIPIGGGQRTSGFLLVNAAMRKVSPIEAGPIQRPWILPGPLAGRDGANASLKPVAMPNRRSALAMIESRVDRRG
jgi:hypothetical protein